MLYFRYLDAGVAQLARASAFQAEGRGFESRLPLHGINNLGADVKFYFYYFTLQQNHKHFVKFNRCPYGSGVEHFLGKEEVVSSSLTMGPTERFYGQKYY